MELKVLPANIANLIAAGEVVQRPASVVKELMENSLDAGADKISVILTDSGKTLIQVIDNGKGMSPEEAVLCFERHATSKIASADDLEQIMTFGFRGEALASIASVADVVLKTKREQDEVGCEVHFAESKLVSKSDIALTKGTNFAVRNLFYNVPARRKFLKSENVELRHVIEEFTRVALTRPDVDFSFSHNGKDVFVLRPAKSLKFRILDILGSGVVGDLVDIDAKTNLVEISGFIGKPDSAKKTLGNQYLFVNGRFFKSLYLHKAVMKAYEDMIPEGATPSYFIYLKVDAHSIDVNIHPSKTEIKFEDDNIISQVLSASIKEALGKNAFGASLDFDMGEVVNMPVIGKHFDEYRPAKAPTVSVDPNYNPFNEKTELGEQKSFDFRDYSTQSSSYSLPSQSIIDKREDYGKLFEEKTVPTSQIIVVQGKYIITPVKSGLMTVNIKRARERILYERFLRAFSKNAHITQNSLFPVQVQVGLDNRIIFDEHTDLLTSLGFDIRPFGNDTVVVNGVPEGFSIETSKVYAMVSDLLIILSEDYSALQEMLETSIAEKFAILGASVGDNLTSPLEAQNLLDLLFSCENSEYTSSGHKILTVLTIDDLDKKF